MTKPATHPWRILLAVLLTACTVVGPLAGGAWASDAPSWSLLSPATSPPALVDASAAFDNADQDVVVFGGRLADGRLSDATWVWDGSTWSEAHPYGSIPPARERAAMAFDPSLGQLILFGGLGTGGVLLDDTWAWNGVSWYPIEPTTTPGGREGAAFAPDPGGGLVLFGGYGVSDFPTASSSHARIIASPSTSTTTSTTTTSPSSTTTTSSTTTSGASTTTSPGATTTTTTPSASTTADTTSTRPAVLDDTWVLGPGSSGVDTWTPESPGTSPPPLAGASMAAEGSDTLLFGGIRARPGATGPLSAATWEWNGSNWKRLSTKAAPSPRQGAVSADDSDLGGVILFGGHGAHGALGGTWAWHDNTWTRLQPQSPPTARRGATGAYDPVSHQLVVFGGLGSDGHALRQTEILTKIAPAKVTTTPVATTSPSTTAHADGARTSPTTTTSSTSTSTGRHPLEATAALLHRGGVVTLTGSGFLPGARITITFHSVPAVVVATTRANSHGDFRVDVTVPVDAAMGLHHFVATGRGPHGITTLITQVRVVALALGGGVSGLATGSLTALAVAIPVVTWFAMGAATRLRRRTRPA